MTVALITEGLLGGFSPDASPPVVVVVSPTPGALPGAAGGFSADYQTAKITPVVLQVTDTGGSGDLKYVSIDVTFTDSIGVVTVEAVYRAGNFVGLYTAGSYQIGITNGLEFHVSRTGGWPGHTTEISTMSWDVDVVDGGGNLT